MELAHALRGLPNDCDLRAAAAIARAAATNSRDIYAAYAADDARAAADSAAATAADDARAADAAAAAALAADAAAHSAEDAAPDWLAWLVQIVSQDRPRAVFPGRPPVDGV
jgi:hypothetical protein